MRFGMFGVVVMMVMALARFLMVAGVATPPLEGAGER